MIDITMEFIIAGRRSTQYQHDMTIQYHNAIANGMINHCRKTINMMKIQYYNGMINHCRKTINMTNKMNELSLKEKACKSLLANVLDMDDDLRSYIHKLTSMFLKSMINLCLIF